MRVLIISKDGDTLDLALRLRDEGHEVTFSIQDRAFRKVGNGFGLRKSANWRAAVSWVGRDGLILFDQTGWGREQDELRKEGYSVVGGSEGGDRLELDRCHAQKIFEKSGMKTVVSRHFTSAEKTIDFVRKNKRRWVVKQNSDADKCFSYDGRRPDGEDVISLLENYSKYTRDACCSIDLQERVVGVELAVTRYFNGTEWVGPVMMNMEHKKLFPGGLGPKTPEMGTLMWFDNNEQNKLFRETLLKITPYLQKIRFKGCFDINCIVTEGGAVPLEATPRFGYPTIHGEAALLLSPWSEFLKAVADGRAYDLKWRKGFCVVVLVAVPPFPYQAINSRYNPEGLGIYFKNALTEEERNNVHFSEVTRVQDQYTVAANSGYVLCVTGTGRTVSAARDSAYALADKIHIPKMFYRNDIGRKFLQSDRALLMKWEYL
jgi:phosphoribosylamine--glycine ligase